MRFSKIILCSFVMLSALAAKADQVCAAYNLDGTCQEWLDTNSGSYTPNIPGYIGNPADPSSSCACSAYNENDDCVQYSCSN